MIESVDRMVQTPVRECPYLVEGILGETPEGFLITHHFEVEPEGDDWFRIFDTDSGVSLSTRGDTMVRWLKPEDMNNPVVQAEIIAGLASMGIEL